MQAGSGRLAFAAAALALLLFQALPGPRPLDDAYITFRYARNLSQGMGFVYNAGERVQGTTTPLYTLALAAVSAAAGSSRLPAAAFLMALAADAVNAWLLYRLARHLLGERLPAYLAAAVFLLQPLRLNVAAGGMETSLFVMCLLAMYDSALLRKNALAAGAWAAASLLVRLDAALAILPLGLYLLVSGWKSALRFGATAALLALPWFAWAALYFGSPIPHSIVAKNASYQGSSVVETVIFLFTFLSTGTVGPYRQILVLLPGLIPALFCILIGLCWFVFNRPEGLAVVAYPLLYYLVMIVQKAPMFFTWYYLPLMPGFLLLIFAALRHMTAQASPRVRGALLAFAALVMIAVPAYLLKTQPGWSVLRENERVYERVSPDVRPLVKDGQVVFAPDIGVVGWQLENARILDPVGLVSPESLAYHHDGMRFEVVFPEIIRGELPDWILSRSIYLAQFWQDPWFEDRYALVREQQEQPGQPGVIYVYRRK